MKNKFYSFLVLILAVFYLPTQAQNTYYVDPANALADDSNDGTSITTPWKTLNLSAWTSTIEAPTTIILVSDLNLSSTQTLEWNKTGAIIKGNTADIAIQGMSDADFSSETVYYPPNANFFEIYNNTITFKDIVLKNLRRSVGGTDGGMIKTNHFVNLTLENVTVKNVKIEHNTIGGAINAPGNLTCKNTTFENCIAKRGGAIALNYYGDDARKHVFENCTFKNNSTNYVASASSEETVGGAITIAAKNADISFDDCYFASNEAVGNIAWTAGGAINLVPASAGVFNLTIKNSTFDSNQSQYMGGAIFLNKAGSGTVNTALINNVFYKNSVNTTTASSYANVFECNGNTITGGSLQIINNTFYKNNSEKAQTQSSVFVNSWGANADLIVANNLVLDKMLVAGNWVGNSFQIDDSGGTNLWKTTTIKNNIFDAWEGWNSTPSAIGDALYVNQVALKNHRFTDQNTKWTEAALDESLTVPAQGVPYLKITTSSLALDAGTNEILYAGVNIVPQTDIRGSGITNAKDVGSFESEFDPTSISSDKTIEIYAYPNPFIDKLYLNEKVKGIQVFDVTGKCIVSLQNVSEIDTSNFVEGIYFVKLTDNDGNESVQRLLK